MCSTFLTRTTKYVFKWDVGYPVVKKLYTRRETSRQSQLSLSLSLSLSPPLSLYIYVYTCVCVCVCVCGPGSSVGIATDYGLDGPGSNPGGDEIFHPPRPALVPTQSPVKWVPGLSRG